MIAIDNTLISEDLLEKKFVCDLSACKGACCEEGDLGAPLLLEEVDAIEQNLQGIRDFMSEAGLALLDSVEGFYEMAPDQELVTTTFQGRACVFAVKSEEEQWQCAIELAYKAGKSDFLKPISCHLYPVRIQEFPEFTAVNYHQWDICSPACACGEALQVPVYKFLKTPLIRRFGEDWYTDLDAYAKHVDGQK